MKARGCVFLTIPKTYYKNLRERLRHSKTVVKEDMDILENLNILVDFDENGYLLQVKSWKESKRGWDRRIDRKI